MWVYGEVDVKIHLSLTSELVGERSASRPRHFTAGEIAPGIHWIGGQVGLRSGLDDMDRKKV